MGLDQFAPSRQKAFVFTEYLEEGNFEAHSCGNGRFIQGAPSADLEICFRLYKTQSFLDIQIHEDNLLQWLRAIPSLSDDLSDDLFDASISMGTLLPRYPEMSAKFDQDKRDGHSFDALELFVRHFLREGSVFASFGFEHLYEERILTELHFHDIQSQNRSMSEDLDLLDEAIDEVDERDIKGSSQPFLFMNERFQAQLQTAIRQRDPIAVDKVLAKDPGFVDAKTLCLAIRYYERTVFHLLLKHGAQVNGVGMIAEPLYRAAKSGRLDAVQLLLSYDANKEGGDSCISATPLSGAVSGGHLEIVQYLVEEKGANINGNKYKSPLSRAIKHRHLHIFDYLVRAGANVLEEDYFVLLPQFVGTKQAVLGDILERFIAGMGNEARDLLFWRAVSEGHLEIVRHLVETGADVNPDTRNCDPVDFLMCSREHSSPLAVAASNGHLGIVRYLVEAGANVNPHKYHRDASDGGNSDAKIPGCMRPHYSPLAAAAKSNKSEVAEFLSSIGATLLEGEDKIYVLDNFRPLHVHWCMYGIMSVGEFLDKMKPSAAIEVKDCPAVAAIQAQERRTMARRLLAKIANSCEKLLDASTMQDVSAGLMAFVDQVGTSTSVWRSGTRAIRDICEGYMPRSLSDIVSALQVANAMRSVVPPSRLVYTKKEFVDDIPRWAALLSPDDQRLFFEIASYLWGIPAATTAHEMADSLTRPLMFLQNLVIYVVKTHGLFDHGPGNSCGSYRLQALRQQYPFAMRHTHTCERRLTLAEWDPLPKQAAQESPHTNVLKPPDPEGEEFSILARITVLMAGAIFGAILLYLCLSRYGFSTFRLPILTSDAGQGWASDQIITRNNVLLALYIGLTSPVDLESRKSTDDLLPKSSPLSHELPDSRPTERVRDHMAAIQPSYEGDYSMIDSS
ncbi:hypothetical protein TrVFT333_006799, partial [Trichoderma virens FT-333]